MYHTHFDELRQQYGGLVGALIVLEPGEQWDPEREILVLVGEGKSGRGQTFNGSETPPVREVRAGTTYRIRIANIAVDRPLTHFHLMRDSTSYATWRPVAKDGWALSGERATSRPAWQRVGTGETADFEFTPEAGEYVLEMRGGPNFLISGPPRRGPLITAQRFRVVTTPGN